MDAGAATDMSDVGSAPQGWRAGFAPPRIDLEPFTPAELHELFRGGEVAADACERLLASAARAAGALDVAIGEGLHALRQGDRLARLGCHLDDYAREALDLGRRTAENLARLGASLRTRPLLRDALRAGRVRIRAAETVHSRRATLRANGRGEPPRCAPTSLGARYGESQTAIYDPFRQYVEERLQLPPRAVEQRAALEERLWRSPALQEARRQGVAYEKLRVLTRLRESDIASWVARARGLTCIAMRRAVEGERERQMRAARKIAVPLPRRVAVLLAAAVHTVRGRVGRFVAAGSCLAVIAAHFIETWSGSVKGPASRSQKVRERDQGFCQVPGCSRRAAAAHHIAFRSHGGSNDLENQIAVCGFHHHRCIHGGYLAVSGQAPGALTWLLGGEPWAGPATASSAGALDA